MKNLAKYLLLFLFLLYPVNSFTADFTTVWDETIPSGSEPLSQGDDRVREFKTQIRERCAVDHYFLADETGVDSIGYHKWISFIQSDTIPDTTIYGGRLWEKSDGFLWFAPKSGSPSQLMLTAGDQTVAGKKSFSTFPEMTISDDPTLDSQLVTKSYVDTQIPLLSQSVQVDTAIGTTDISTNSTTYVDMPDMTYTDTFTAGNVVVTGKVPLTIGSNDGGFVQLVIDDVAVDTTWIRDGSGDAGGTAVVTWAGWFTAASHSIQVKWKQHASGDSVQNTGTTMPRRLTIIRGLN